MQLFSRADATEVGTPDGVITPSEDGSFDVPQETVDVLLRIHLNGEPQWETAGGRNDRLAAEELARRRSPEALYDMLSQPGGGGQLTAEQLREAEEERKKIKAERAAEELEDQRIEQERIAAAAKLAADVEQSRLDSLPVRVGDTVKLADPVPPSAGVLTAYGTDAPVTVPGAEWRGVVSDVVAESDGSDVASFEGQSIRFALAILTVVDAEAEQAAERERVVAEAKAEQDRVDAEKKAADDKAAEEKKAAAAEKKVAEK